MPLHDKLLFASVFNRPLDPATSLFGIPAAFSGAVPSPLPVGSTNSNPFALTPGQAPVASAAGPTSSPNGTALFTDRQAEPGPPGSNAVGPNPSTSGAVLLAHRETVAPTDDVGTLPASAALQPIITGPEAQPWFTSELPPILAEEERFQPAREALAGAVGVRGLLPIQTNLGSGSQPQASPGPVSNGAPVAGASSHVWDPYPAGRLEKNPLTGLEAKQSWGPSDQTRDPSATKKRSLREQLTDETCSVADRLKSLPKKVQRTALATIVALVGGLGVGVSMLGSGGPGWAAKWDPVIVPLMEQTSELRGLKFLHPVRVDFLESNAFDAAAVARDLKAKVSNQNGGGRCWISVDGGPKYPMCNFSRPFASEVHPVESAYRALGVPIDAPLPSSNSFGEIGDSLVLARYLPEEHLIEVRGAYSAGLAPTLVHELAHALQDQHFGLSFDGKNSDESLAYRALVEGDAMLTEYRYRFSLPEEESAVVEQADTQTSKDAKARLSAVVGQTTGQKIEQPSAALQLEIDVAEFPYIQGTEFAVAQWKRLAPKEYNQLFRSPPKTTGSILYPGRDPHVGGQKVKRAAATPGRVQYLKGDVVFGPLLFLAAMERSGGAVQGQMVASAWRGESTGIFQDSGTRRVCFASDIVFGGDSGASAQVGLADWAQGHGMSAKIGWETVHLEGCDPFGTV